MTDLPSPGRDAAARPTAAREHTDRAYHDAIAGEYDAVVVQPRAWLNDRLFAELLEGVAGARALDLGCGTGHMALRLAPRFGHVLGIDHSAGMLAVARARASAAGHSHLQFREATMPEALAGLDPGYDAITMVGFLHHLTFGQVGELLAACRPLLAPGGSLVVAEPFLVEAPEPESIRAWNAASPLVRAGYSAHAEDPDEAPLDEPAFRALLASSGWRSLREARCWELLAHAHPPRLLERWRLSRLYARHRGHGNVLALRLRPG